jgi:hypothetical protein
MPLTYAEFTSPRGVRMVRSLVSGELGLEEAQLIEKALLPGGDMHGLPYLAVAEKGTSFSPEFRGYFSHRQMSMDTPAIAMVMPTTPLRVLVSFIVRVAQRFNRGAITQPIQFFASEVEAITWLEEHARMGDQAGTHLN